jgi:hypothetical protein
MVYLNEFVNSTLLRIALPMVISSAYYNSSPMATPLEMVVILT